MLPDTSIREMVDMANKLELTNILSEQLETYLFNLRLGFFSLIIIYSFYITFISLLNY